MTNTLKIKTIIITVDNLYYYLLYISCIYKIKSQRPLSFNIIKGVPSLNCSVPYFKRTTVLLLWWLTMLCKHYWMTYFWRNNSRKTNLHNTDNRHKCPCFVIRNLRENSTKVWISKQKKSMVVPPPSGHREDVLFSLLKKFSVKRYLIKFSMFFLCLNCARPKKRQFKTLNSY